MEPATHNTANVTRKLRIGIILASALAAAPAVRGAGPPDGLAKIVAARETASAAARLNYTYRQSVVIEDFDRRGRKGGVYTEVREIIFSPETGRSERFVKGPNNSLRFLKLTEEDFRDIREVQPFLFTSDNVWAYETEYKGTDFIDGKEYYLLRVRPRQIFYGQRYFDGLLWIDRNDLAVARSEGKAVPPVFKKGSDNLFPAFTTIREKVDGNYWFPVFTRADDVLPFRTGPQRIRMTIKYSDYRRFRADSTVRFGEPEP